MIYKISKNIVLIWAILVFLLPIVLNAAEKNKIIIGAGEWDPYISEKLPNYGIIGKIVTESFKKVGIKVEYKWYPWKRSMIYTKLHKVDVTMPWRKTKERDQFFIYSDPIFEDYLSFFYLKKNPIKFKNFSSLNGLRVGGTRGYTYSQKFQVAVSKKKFTYVLANSDVLNLKNLLEGVVDVIACNPRVCNELIVKTFPKHQVEMFDYSRNYFGTGALRLLISKTHPNAVEIIQKFNKGLKQVKKEQKIKLLISFYSLPESAA